MAGAVVVLGVTTYSWSLAAGSRSHNSAKSPPPPIAMAPVGKCVVSYTVWSDTGKNFKASLTIANRDTVAVKDWNLWFVMPGGQVMSGNGKEKVHQIDRGVTVTSRDALNPQQTKTMQLTGRYTESNSAPMVFKLGTENCETYVSGKPGDPSRPVQQLTDGSTRLGPVPTTTNPAPGISINPGGVAVPVPIKTSTKPNGGATTPIGLNPTTGSTPTVTGPPPAPPPTPSVTTSPPPTTAQPTTPPTTPPTQAPVVVPVCDPDVPGDCPSSS
jgi:serine/threonine-protein kinase